MYDSVIIDDGVLVVFGKTRNGEILEFESNDFDDLIEELQLRGFDPWECHKGDGFILAQDENLHSLWEEVEEFFMAVDSVIEPS